MHGPRIFRLGCLAAFLAAASAVRAYVLEGYHWTPGEPIVMDLQLGRPEHTLLDGSTSWNQVAAAAMAAWNPYLESGVQFEEHDDAASPKKRDGKNEVFFSKAVYGEDFGDDVLAITLSFFDTRTKIKSEADVVFNAAVDFDSYRGALRIDQKGKGAYDLRRIATHECGHVLGLDHVPQYVNSIMTPVVTDIDTIQSDDIAGVRAIYARLFAPPVITSALSANAPPTGPFLYQITATGPDVGFGVENLPAGLSFSPHTGAITGSLTTPGTYRVLLTARNPIGTDTEILTIAVTIKPEITSAGSATGQTGQLFLYQTTAKFDPVRFEVFPPLPPGLSLDTATGLISGVPTASSANNVSVSAINRAGRDTASLTIKIVADNAVATVHAFVPATGGGPDRGLILGSDGNFYGVLGSGPGGAAAYRMAPDGTVTVLHYFRYGNGPPPSPLIQAADGNFYGVTSLGGASGLGFVFRMTPDGATTTLHSFQADTGITSNIALVQGSDGNFYGSAFVETPSGDAPGTIFRMTPDGALTVLHGFGRELAVPSTLIQTADGNFYGVSAGGGDAFVGAIFRMTPDGTVTILHSFNGADGSAPLGPLVQGRDGSFYGVTTYGGPDAAGPFQGAGTVFKVTPDGTLTTIHAFSGAEGGKPTALTAGQDGNFYGTTNVLGVSVAGVPQGVLYRLAPDGALTILHRFTNDEGTLHTTVVQSRDGSLYGAETYNGDHGAGIIYRATPDAPPLTVNVPPVSLAVTKPEARAGGAGGGQFTVRVPSAPATDLVIFYKLKGDALDGLDFQHLGGSVTIKTGATRAAIKIKPRGDLRGASRRTVKLVLTPEPSYKLDGPAVGKVKILAP